MKRVNLEDIITDIINACNEKKPFSMIRLGDGEIEVLKGTMIGQALWVHPANNHCQKNSAQFLVDRTRQAVKNADCLGIFAGDKWTYDAMKKAGCEANDRPEFYAFGNIHLVTRKNFVDEVLKKRRLALVGNSMERWDKEILKQKIPNAQSIVSLGKNLIYTKEDYDNIVRFLKDNKDKYDVALISMGVWAEALVDEVKKLGKVGIDFGHAADHQIIGEYEINLKYDSIDDYYKNSKCPIALK